ncbi:AMP-binding protein [Streptomyces sp. NPDC056192]|uniref:AMP-binding protein n=1 Tax=Streptomyces sp. NPDC056192 TaxID=3345743 RepID=UPI0035E1A29D
MLAVDLVRRGAARFAGRTAVRFENRSLTYAEVDEAANRLAHVLAGLGVGRGDRVGLLLGNGLWSISVDFACLKAGAARVPLNGRLSAPEHTRMLQDTGVSLLVYGPDMIITGGYNVYPREVEDALASHPAVGQCAVVGAPDATWVEAVTAFVTLRPGAAVSEAALRDHVRARLAGYKVPKTVHFVETIPYSPVGKILRRALRDPLWEGK